ncbi:SusC/RagA family TonB-linked outer membrane protein [Marivirga arenosa]|uniref:SusC/RagA family TonB-linked outer membrane protein n=1 Tax=Marivirga arenosa TaxID=3059076 RepID=A0AA51N584_9BACT|nr:SusC/RagA family TonB-linked outer membrane protein [Marivirga sp. ABR2-2]WMN06444.1 SusC/RagA family TonB-linked outer membrane protein [Marivirga sp. ABR2-2]
MMKRLLLMLSFFLIASHSWAQDRIVSGTVTDENGPLPGVNVIVKGTTNGITTDLDGNYKLPLPSNAEVLVFTYIGYEKTEVTIGSKSQINVTMVPDVQQLGEVVVTALGIEREQKSLGYSVQEVGGDEIIKAGETNIVNSLQGKIAGVQIGGNSGALGGSSRILIRGANSIAGNNQPLFVVDGTPIDNSNFNTTGQSRGASGYDYGNAAQDINPEDIESMSVLKGASAAALYGNRASNGVIIITTKKGKKGKGIGVSVNSGVTFATPLVLPEYQNEYGGGFGPFATNSNGQDVVSFAVDQSWGPKLDGRPVRQWYSYYEDHPNFGEETPWEAHPDNIKNFYQTQVTLNNNVSFSGANDNGSFRMSFTNLDQKGIMPNSEMTRNTVNFNGSYFLTDKLSANANVNYVQSRALGRPQQGYGDLIVQFNHFGQRQLDFDELKNYKVEATGAQRSWNRISESTAFPLYADNPYWIRNENFQNDGRDRIFGNIGLNYDFTENLSLSGRVLTDFYTDRREGRVAEGSVGQSFYSEDVRQVSETNMDMMLKYDGEINDQISLSTFIGGNIRMDKYNRNYGQTQGGLSVPGFYNLENSIDRNVLSDFTSERQINSWFASLTMGYEDLVFLDATLRNDVSSTLPDGDNSYFYPSVSGTFIFSELDALNGGDIFTFGKLRGSVAQVGNDTDPYRISTVYAPGQNFGVNPAYSLPGTLNNPNLRPEQTNSYEIGTELRFLNDRLTFDATYYNNVSTDQIFEVDVSAASGYNAQIINAGRMVNQGAEISLSGAVIQADDFQWNVLVNWAKNDNRVEELAEGIDNYRLANELFGVVSLDARVGERYGTIYGNDFLRDDNGRKVIGSNGNYLATSSPVALGSVLADFTGGVRNSFNYKGVNLSFLVDFQKGGALHSVTNLFAKYSGMTQETVEGNIRQVGLIADGVTEGGEENTTVIDPISFFQGHFGLGGAHVYDASFVKLREVVLSYSLPNSIIGNTPFTKINLAVEGRNLAIISKKIPHLDPENVTNSGNIQGLEGGALPSLRSYGFKVSLGF